MMCKGKLAGVVSFGPNSECGNEHMPGVYTNISIFAPVIDQTFRSKIQRQVGATYLRLSTSSFRRTFKTLANVDYFS